MHTSMSLPAPSERWPRALAQSGAPLRQHGPAVTACLLPRMLSFAELCLACTVHDSPSHQMHDHGTAGTSGGRPPTCVYGGRPPSPRTRRPRPLRAIMPLAARTQNPRQQLTLPLHELSGACWLEAAVGVTPQLRAHEQQRKRTRQGACSTAARQAPPLPLSGGAPSPCSGGS